MPIRNQFYTIVFSFFGLVNESDNIFWPRVYKAATAFPKLNFFFVQKTGLQRIGKAVHLAYISNDGQVAVTVFKTARFI